jgi:hypothetical protein
MLNSSLGLKINGLTRLALLCGLGNRMPYYAIFEYPKSGGSWLGDMLSDLLNVPFPRNKFPILSPSIMHTHRLENINLKKAVVLWRDPRDIFISEFYHSTHFSERNNGVLVQKTRSAIGYSDELSVEELMSNFIFYKKKQKGHKNWINFFNKFYGNHRYIHVKYEQLLEDGASILGDILEYYGASAEPHLIKHVVEKNTFKNLTGRDAGGEDRSSFLRKGIAGDWKNYVNNPVISDFFDGYNPYIKKLNYETKN